MHGGQAQLERVVYLIPVQRFSRGLNLNIYLIPKAINYFINSWRIMQSVNVHR